MQHQSIAQDIVLVHLMQNSNYSGPENGPADNLEGDIRVFLLSNLGITVLLWLNLLLALEK